MKKGLIIIAGAALLLSSCQEDGIRNDIESEKGINFNTFANKATRAENSGVTSTNGLEAYHETFAVWGNKYVNSVKSEVFKNIEVKYASSDPSWSYSPLRFWDKAADKYDFFAAAPATEDWDFSDNIFKLSGFEVDGQSLEISASCLANAVMPNGKDIMIATDYIRNGMLASKDYSTIELEFNHILSRLNIAVKKATILEDYKVMLDKIKVINMLKQGDFDESQESGSALASGSVKRWDASSTYEFGYEEEDDDRQEVASSDAYIYQGLIIPQEVKYRSIKLDGSDASSDAMPYIVVGYTLYDASGDAVPGGEYEYYYNLADIFNGSGAASGDPVKFCEGWMNTLKITINPEAIDFDAKVFDWDGKEIGVDVPDINKK